MAGRVPEHIIQQVVRGADLVRIVGQHCSLQKKGNSYWACCPFHEEKTASFKLDVDEGLYYCFGCKEGGNVFTFLEKMEGLSFGEALQRLASDAGVDLSQYSTESGPPPGETARMRALHELATTFYQKCLEKRKPALDYLESRHINEDSIERWRLGYAPDGWEHFLNVARKRDFDPATVARAGLAAERREGNGYYDRFRNRLMFPIADVAGRTIAFGARALDADDEPKYLNSPETPLFSKGRRFFGISHAKTAIRTGGTALVLEGYTDVIMAHQEGLSESVAVLGTALTEEHARALDRMAERVVLLFDADQAGLHSAMRSIEMLLNTDLDVRVASLPQGQDPCDYVVANGGDALRERVEQARDFFEFRLEMARREHDTDSLAGRTAAFQDVMELAVAVNDPARRDMIVRETAHELGVSEGAAWAHVRRAWRGRREGGTERAEGRAARLSATETLPRELLGLLLASPELVPEAAESLDTQYVKECTEKGVLLRLLEAGQTVDVQHFLATLQESAAAQAAAGALAEEQERRRHASSWGVRERLEDYLDYIERKKSVIHRSVTDGTGSSVDELDDEQLRAVHEMFKERDRKSVQ